MPKENEAEEVPKMETAHYSHRPQRKNYQKKMDMYIDLYQFLKECKNELYLPLFDISDFSSRSVKMLVKD